MACAIFLIASCKAPKDIAYQHDQETDLLWQNCPAGQSFNNTCIGRPITMSWDEALRFCTNIADKSPWRLPNRNELLTYHHSEKSNHGLAFTNLYWTSTSNKHDPQMAWYLIPRLDWLYFNLKELDGLVLCVSNVKST